LINEVESEISSRQALATKLENDITTYKRLSELKKSEVEAVVQALRGELRNEGRRSFWLGFLVKLMFFALGLVGGTLLKLI